MKVALVHDYLNEYGGAERVLEALCELYPEAPIYTAFYRTNSPAHDKFKHKKIITSWAQHVPFFATKLHSPLRFLAPQIWESFDFTGYDVVISSSSWYITKGVRVPKDTLHISYIHTPPRYLYGYKTASNIQKHPLVKLYAIIVNKGLRQFDYYSAQKVDVLVANSKEVQARIKKFWRRDSVIIYPPVELNEYEVRSSKFEDGLRTPHPVPRTYFLTGGRLVGPKHFDLAIQAANTLKVPLKIFGTGPEETYLKSIAGPTVEFLGKVDEITLASLYAKAQAFLALADDEDFGITPVESMMAGTPVIAYQGGGYQETVIDGQTGIFINELSPDAVIEGIQRLNSRHFTLNTITNHAQKFSTARFKQEISNLVDTELKNKRN